MFLFLLLLVAAASAKSKQTFCFDGEQRPHEFDPSRYYKCSGNQWQVNWCQINYIYDTASGFCYLPNFPTVGPTLPNRICIPGTRVEDVFDNTKYKECSSDGTRFITRYCKSGSIFVGAENMCVSIQTSTYRPTRTTPWPTTTTTPFYGPCRESAGHDGYKPDIYNCKNFYQCASGLWTQRSCGEGTIWNQAIPGCDHNRGQCRPSPPPTYRPTYRPTTRYPPIIEVKK